MAYQKKFGDNRTVKVAIAPAAPASGAFTGVPVDATGYNRASFVFSLGTPPAAASLDAKVWESATSGGTYTSRASAALTQITSGAGSNITAVIEVVVDQTKPWVQVSGAVGSSIWPVAAVCVLDTPSRKPPTTGSQQVVSV